MVFVRVTIDSHSEAEARKFEQEVMALVVSCYSIVGYADFLFQVVATDMGAYADFVMSVILRLSGIKEMQSMFVLKEI